MMTKKEKRRVPELRFDGFEGEWEKRTIENILTIGSGKDYKHLQEGDIPVYGTGGLMTKVNDYLYDGESIGIGRKGTIDKPVYLNGKFWTVDTLFYTHSFIKSVPKFIYNQFQRINWYRYNEASGVPSLSKKTIEKININTPKIEEQQKIATFLTSIDTRIQQLEKKKTLLEQYKKGVMQKIFSQEIRFKDDDGKEFGKWEKKRVSEMFRVTRGTVLSMTKVRDSEDSEFKYPVYSSQTKNNGLSGYYDEYLYENAITWTTDGANAGDVNYRTGKFYCTNVCGVLLSDEGYANTFIAEKLNSVSRRYVSYVGNPKLMNGVMSEIVIEVPSIPEQTKIAHFLSSLDRKIAVTDGQIEKTKEWKKGLLQRMFV